MKNCPKKTGKPAMIFRSFARKTLHSIAARRLALAGAFLCAAAPSPSFAQQSGDAGGAYDSDIRKSAKAANPGDPMFIEINTREYQIYLGQTMRVNYDVYIESGRGQVYYDVLEPDFRNWYAVEGPPQRAETVSVSGKSYQKEPFATYYVTPAKTGLLQLPRLFVKIPFLQDKPWITLSPQFVEVIPPPQPMPMHYAVANVGSFQVSSQISSTRVRVGQTLVLNFSVTCDASANGITPVPYSLGKLSVNFKSLGLMRDKITETADEKGIRTSIGYHMQLVALTPGKFTLPPLSIVTFHPERHQYMTVSSQPIEVTVEPSNIVENLPNQEISLNAFKDDVIRPISLRRSEPYSDFLWIFIILPPLLLLTAIAAGDWHKNKKRKICRSAKAEKINRLENTFLSATDSREQLRSLRDIAKETFRIRIRVSEKEIVKQFDNILGEEEKKIIFPILHKLIVNSASTHLPITAKEAIDALGILRSHYDK